MRLHRDGALVRSISLRSTRDIAAGARAPKHAATRSRDTAVSALVRDAAAVAAARPPRAHGAATRDLTPHVQGEQTTHRRGAVSKNSTDPRDGVVSGVKRTRQGRAPARVLALLERFKSIEHACSAYGHAAATHVVRTRRVLRCPLLACQSSRR